MPFVEFLLIRWLARQAGSNDLNDECGTSVLVLTSGAAVLSFETASTRAHVDSDAANGSIH